ncbi:leucyl/phenylalanyl-tRNA--protein transferase [Phycicoccus endophyticus]|uniref:leucyl/phenylalanyl-tRNA--protein transferase n=1 Tax=Phycicoccus endophyticus TaxID=1690220 RepID=UPI00140BE85A|nr:leucyl/phenylalanyl-tRNA--protein transferase [Phycicoccus endophyticus]NHI20933.1 leucyl/phenylalanyl-tRNA--protein transferase [Phycicoccus endophyticus]GGL22443.1 leucyl/phenylalanyl-tRNA--protein transferase [Phycicoccus endophyticus]
MVFPPVEPPPTAWLLGSARATPGDDLVAAGADLEPGTLLAAYRMGLFPMGLGRDGHGTLGWWSPDPRGVIPAGGLRVRPSLRKVLGRFEVSVDRAFAEVVAGCGDPSREGRWITEEVAQAYLRLHELGWAHSVEVWQAGELVGGLYGVAVGGLFAGESMFHRVRDASKVALVGLVARFHADGDPRRLVDVQWATEHLRRLGAQEWPREEYLRRLRAALQAPQVDLASATPTTTV